MEQRFHDHNGGKRPGVPKLQESGELIQIRTSKYARYSEGEWASLIEKVAKAANRWDKAKDQPNGDISTDDFNNHGSGGALDFWCGKRNKERKKEEPELKGRRDALIDLIKTRYPDVEIKKEYREYTAEDWKYLIKKIAKAANKWDESKGQPNGNISTDNFNNHGHGGALRFWRGKRNKELKIKEEPELKGDREALNDLIKTYYSDVRIVKLRENYIAHTETDLGSLIKKVAKAVNKWDEAKGQPNGDINTEDFRKHKSRGALEFWLGKLNKKRKKEGKPELKGVRKALIDLIKIRYPDVKIIEVKQEGPHQSYTKDDWKSLIKKIAKAVNKWDEAKGQPNGDISTEDFNNHGPGGALMFWLRKRNGEFKKGELKLKGAREALIDLIKTHYPDVQITKAYKEYMAEDWKSLIKEVAKAANKWDEAKGQPNCGISTSDFGNHGYGSALRFWAREHGLSGDREVLDDMLFKLFGIKRPDRPINESFNQTFLSAMQQFVKETRS